MVGLAPVPDGSGAMFDLIARRYDLLNRLMTLGLDQRWRERLIAALQLTHGRVVDIATGTADVAICAAQLFPGLQLVAIDPSAQMLAVAQEKLVLSQLTRRVELQHGTAEALPLADGSMDGAVTAFGFRNFADRAKGLAEMRRVTRTGGRVAILEIGKPSGVLAPLIGVYTRVVVPLLGALLSGVAQYRYLANSAAAFPARHEVEAMLRAAGLVEVQVTPLGLGAVHLFVGRVP